MHLKRWLTGIIAAPVLIYVIGWGPRPLFHLLLLLAALQGLTEFFRFSSREMPRFIFWTVIGLTVLLFLAVSMGEFFLVPAVVFLWVLVPSAFMMFTHTSGSIRSTEILGQAVFAPVYIALPLALLMVMDRFPGGRFWIFFLLLVVFAGDTGAFYVGRAFGRHKLHPLVSPGKTWEGAIGGWLSSMAVSLVWCQVFALHPFNYPMVVLTTGLSVCGQVGDLVESMLKRNYGVKDSGGILPGHGGILDRIDALLFSIPLLYAYLSWAVP